MSPRRTIVLTLLLIATTGAWLWVRHWESTIEPRYNLVEEGLYIGATVKELPPATKAIVNLCGIEDRHVVEASLWEPVQEGNAEPTLDWLKRTTSFIAEQRRAGRVTFVHCMAGMNRSGTVVTAYLMIEHGWDRDTALAFLQRQRPRVRPDPGMMRLLEDFEREHRGEGKNP